ncbi:MAG: hypothetical protein LBP64_09490 [Tannerella sp.]|jgi:hypothetical protein|nr:hypothetical protein [Tannerella sp.]
MLEHPLHKKIGDILSLLETSIIKIICDEACGGSQQISLFAGNYKGRKNRLCKVDAMIIQDGLGRIIIEIEESGFIPTKICGKYLTSALSTQYMRDKESIDLKDILFIQVIDAKKLSDDKIKQLELIEERLNEIHFDSVKQYKLLPVKKDADINEIEGIVNNFLSASKRKA